MTINTYITPTVTMNTTTMSGPPIATGPPITSLDSVQSSDTPVRGSASTTTTIASLIGVIILLLLILIVGITMVMMSKKIIKKCHIKFNDSGGQVKYVSSKGGYLATENSSRNNCGLDNRVVSIFLHYNKYNDLILYLPLIFSILTTEVVTQTMTL